MKYSRKNLILVAILATVIVNAKTLTISDLMAPIPESDEPIPEVTLPLPEKSAPTTTVNTTELSPAAKPSTPKADLPKVTKPEIPDAKLPEVKKPAIPSVKKPSLPDVPKADLPKVKKPKLSANDSDDSKTGRKIVINKYYNTPSEEVVHKINDDILSSNKTKDDIIIINKIYASTKPEKPDMAPIAKKSEFSENYSFSLGVNYLYSSSKKSIASRAITYDGTEHKTEGLSLNFEVFLADRLSLDFEMGYSQSKDSNDSFTGHFLSSIKWYLPIIDRVALFASAGVGVIYAQEECIFEYYEKRRYQTYSYWYGWSSDYYYSTYEEIKYQFWLPTVQGAVGLSLRLTDSLSIEGSARILETFVARDRGEKVKLSLAACSAGLKFTF